MISREEVEHIARLARLRFEDGEYERLAQELSKILDYVQTLGELDLTGLEPTAHAVALKNVFRADEPRPCLPREQAVANGPAVERGQFVVPRIG
ncbi:MAG: Asp-tRNA(Asn)/Glu-tRNA(Gln) amidotransferase subunit GatC [Thermoleophilia bacterium]|nr:Asp-tRNA(Asn)/Glu-tRNA(Gln) amidotransferase subunit GatC [Thermoleophilia bacterium]